NTARTIGELVAGPEALRAWAPTWGIVFWGLATRSPEALLASDGPFAQVLATVRVEGEPAERDRAVFEHALRHLGPLVASDRMRWRDLLWLLLSWAIQRRPDEEQDGLTALAVQAQQAAPAREEAATMTEAVKKTWIERVREEARRELREGYEKELQA